VPRAAGPGDSNYELTFTLSDVEGDSDSDWDAETEDLMAEAPSSDEIPALVPDDGDSSRREPWHHRFVASWGLGLIVGALALIVMSVSMVGYLLWHTLGLGAALDLPASTLIAGFACAVSLLLISVPMVLLAACLTELVRDVRRLSDKLEHKSGPTRR
jgi:hypothetical protein